jgi:hypothetical protein
VCTRADASKPAVPPLSRRVGLQRSDALGERLEDADANVLEVIDEGVEFSPTEDEQAGWRSGRRGRGARPAIEEGDLAEELARAEVTQVTPFALDAHCAVEDQEEFLAVLAFAHQHSTRWYLDLVCQSPDLLEAGTLALRKERHPLEQLDLSVHDASSHRRAPDHASIRGTPGSKGFVTRWI